MMSGAQLNLGVNSHNVASIFPGGDVGNRPGSGWEGLPYPKTRVTNPEDRKGDGHSVGGPSGICGAGVGTWGNLGFDALRGPGRNNWNLSLFKSFVISESRGSRFERPAESFSDTWNHTQFGGAGQNGGFSNNFGAGNQLQITNAFDHRVLTTARS